MLAETSGAARIVNWAEVFLWGAIGAVFAWRAIREKGELRRMAALLAFAFLAFGASDYVELRTGSWWEPWWLAVWKSACVAVFVWAFVRYRNRGSNR